MRDFNVNWDEVRDEAVKAYGLTRDKAGDVIDAVQEKLNAMEEEKRRNLYLCLAAGTILFILFLIVYMEGRKAGRRKALKERDDWE